MVRLNLVKLSGVWGGDEQYYREARKYEALFDYLVRACRRYYIERTGLFGVEVTFYDCDVDPKKVPPEAKPLLEHLLVAGWSREKYFSAKVVY